MLPFLIFLVAFVSGQPTPGPGTQLSFNKDTVLTPINSERKFWNMPLIAWDEDVAKIAQLTCSQCAWSDVRPQAERQKLLCDLKGLPFKDLNEARYQTVGENREAGGGRLNPAQIYGSTWLNRSSWNCAENSCSSPVGCAFYTQVVWNNTLNMGCGKCNCQEGGSPPPGVEPGDPWIFLVCNFVEAGNFDGKHPFGDGEVRDKACARTYVPQPPPQPVPCEDRTCENTETCPSPLTAATCDSATGRWKAGSVRAADFNPIPLACGLDVTSFTANAGDKLRVDGCGVVTVSGATTFNGNPVIDIDFKGVRGPEDGFYQAFFENASPITGGVWGSAVAQGVWSPSVLLSAQAVTSNTTSYVLLHDSSVPPSTPLELPDGGEVVPNGQSASSRAIRSTVEGSGGDMNDPDLQTEPKKDINGNPVPMAPAPLTPTVPETPNNGSGGPAIPGWAIFLIVLGCILVIIVIIVIIVLLAGGSSGMEKF